MSDLCPNCGADRNGAFCSACGQNDRTYLTSLYHLGKEALAEAFDLDSRIVRTLVALVTKPGFLTQEFVRNRRASYVSPVRLYLSVSVVFVFALSLTGDLAIGLGARDSGVVVGSDADTGLLDIYQELSPAERSRMRTILEKRGLVDASVERQLDAVDANPPAPNLAPWEQRLRDRLLDLLEDPSRAADTVVNRLPVALFVVLPLYAAFLKLLYPRRYYAEHLVFALHLHAFLFLLGTVIMAMPENDFGEVVVGALQAVGGVYYFVALHRAYPQSWLRSFLSFIVINALHVTLIFTAIALTTLVTLFY